MPLRSLAIAFCLLPCLTLAAPTSYRACSLPLPPHTMPGLDGQPLGQASDILLAVARQLNWSVRVDYMPWLRVVEEAKAGRCDLVYTVLKRADYEEFLAFPQQPVQERENVLIVRAGSDLHYDGDLEAFMRQHSLGLYRDKAVDERFEQLRRQPWARVDLANDARQNLEKLLAGRFEAAIENSLTATYELQQLGALSQAQLLTPAINATPAYIAFPRNGRLLAQVTDFDQAMTELRQNPQYREILQRHVGPEPVQP